MLRACPGVSGVLRVGAADDLRGGACLAQRMSVPMDICGPSLSCVSRLRDGLGGHHGSVTGVWQRPQRADVEPEGKLSFSQYSESPCPGPRLRV